MDWTPVIVGVLSLFSGGAVVELIRGRFQQRTENSKAQVELKVHTDVNYQTQINDLWGKLNEITDDSEKYREQYFNAKQESIDLQIKHAKEMVISNERYQKLSHEHSLITGTNAELKHQYEVLVTQLRFIYEKCGEKMPEIAASGVSYAEKTDTGGADNG